MSEEKRYDKPFSHPRWHEPIGGEVVGHVELSEEKQKKAHEDAVAILKSWGIKIKDEPEFDPKPWQQNGNKNIPKPKKY
jgi:trimethylamine:corrinoid methyltransferase-like protein